MQNPTFLGQPMLWDVPKAGLSSWHEELKLILLAFFIQVGFEINDVHLNMTVLKTEPLQNFQ